jgi:putative hydrolase of the HAD superfamily
MPRAILFDLDGTLHDRETTVRALFEAQHARFEAELAGVTRERYLERALALDEHGYRDRDRVFALLARELGLVAALAPRLTANFYEEYPEHAVAFPEATAVLAALRARGFRLGIITNGKQLVQQRKIDRLGFAPLVDVVVISESEGVKKPDARIFQRALERLGVSAAQATYVGDHPVTDVWGSVSSGLSAIWRRTPTWVPPDVEHRAIDTLDELLPMFE